ncbi:MAG TPA: 3-deoxy-D-manno-octulosonate 8-phosphate phosphatase, partial [Bacteroidales bacterium]|nr:3-deoxy-D-manno-octulosonate 8-phosphate phosphatase [Bacteroidales bacterium]
IPDYEVMKQVGLPCCPADAAPEIRAIARYVSAYKGGEGCGRDLLEQILKVQGHWMSEGAFGW